MNPVRNGIIGVAIGDALGVPVEFRPREELDDEPVVGLRERAVHDQPKGTWSDDTSLTLCLADSLTKGYSLEDMAKTFLLWKIDGLWTAHIHLFDIGVQTQRALNDLYRILESGDTESLQYLRYEASEHGNGNGALMRILPLYFYLQHDRLEDRFDTIWEVSALTHPHVRSALACLMYLIMLDELTHTNSTHTAYLQTAKRMREFMEDQYTEEQTHFARLLDQDIRVLPRTEVRSGGYVIETLEASFWCLLNTSSYADAVLAAVNLGHDTDTTGAVTGGLAGMFYGIDTAPIEWYETIAKIDEIEALCDRLHAVYPGSEYAMSPLVQYLTGEGMDSSERTLDAVLGMSDAQLEVEHDYIQWLFPLREQSGAVWDAPTLNTADIAYVAGNAEARANLERALSRMTAFYQWNDHWLAPFDHNHLRITRILKSTRLLLGKEQALGFYTFLTNHIREKDAYIDPKNVAYWTDAMGLSYGNRD